MRAVPADERFWKFIEQDEDGCWIWTGSHTSNGYGHFALDYATHGTKIVLAHRWAYEYVVGLIPPGLELDHTCRNKSCVNPAHLEPVTRLENMERRYAPITHCCNGHPFSASNTALRKRKGAKRPIRHCRACEAKRSRDYRERQRR